MQPSVDKPERIFRGTIMFYITKVWLTIFSLFFWTVAIGMFGGFTYKFTQEIAGIWKYIELLTCLLIPGLCISTINLISVLYMYPEIGTSPKAFWYRNCFRWRSIRWKDIECVTIDQPLFIKQGLFVYSQTLPFYYTFIGRASRTGRKAIFVSRHIRGFQEQEKEISIFKQIE